MPRPKKPARLWQRKDGVWIILDGGKQFGTGGAAGERDRGIAEAALARHIASRLPARTGPAQPSELTVGEALARYIRDCGPGLAAPDRLAWAAKALLPFWAAQTCDAVKGSTCRAYARQRGVSSATVRRELGVLQSALNYVHAEGVLIYAPKVTLTDHGKPRERWLTRDEAAALIRAARHSRNRTLVRFILIGFYTGTRPGAIRALRWVPSLTSGWVDLERGILHRAGHAERETAKRRGDCRIPKQLLAHMRRWRGGELVVSWHGRQVGDIGKAFDAACARARLEDVTPHTLKHTAVTWAFQKGMKMEDAVSFFSTSAATLERVYRQHSPHYQKRAVEVIEGRNH